MPPFPPFSLGVHTFVTLPGVLAAMAQCEKQGKLRIIRLPFVGPWASRQLKVLRRKLATPLARPASKRRPDSATHAAAAARREVGLLARPPPPPLLFVGSSALSLNPYNKKSCHQTGFENCALLPSLILRESSFLVLLLCCSAHPQMPRNWLSSLEHP